jgi:hypothetical protein
MVSAQPLRSDYLRLHPLKQTPEAPTAKASGPAGRQGGKAAP